ncbi:MAG: hypothetical protein IPM54_26320 [Polyangiaceae bacterium]|nr:hypothetical protein [Polyangiaceae bacterium]
MKAVLCCEISVSRIAVFAEMARLERRPELGLLCKAARAQGQRISVAMVQSVLPGLPDAGANNVIGWCRTLGLCDEHGGITALGEDVAESNEAPVPEQGVYRLWLVEHPLIGRRVLAVDPLASRNDQRFDNIQQLPVEPERGKVFRSVVKSNERFIVRDLPTNHGQPGCFVEQTHATCRLRWTLDFDAERDHWQLEGSIEVAQGNGKYAMRPMQHEPEKDGLELWKLAEIWGRGPLREFGVWNADERRLAVPFQGLAEREIETFRKTLTLRRVEVLGKGMYDNVPLEDVPIGPFSTTDAQQWAMARFDRHVIKKPAYRSRAEVRARFAELTEGTPLEKFSPRLPAHEDLLRTHEKDLGSFWALAAPVDLAPHPVAPDELAAMRIGSHATLTTSSEPQWFNGGGR